MDDAYRIGVTIAMVSNAPTVLQGIQRNISELGKSVDTLTGNLAAARSAMTAFGAGTATLSATGALADAGKDLVHRQGLFQQQLQQIRGMIPVKRSDEIASATSQAWTTANDAVTPIVAENLKSTRQRVQGFGDVARARRNLTPMAQVQFPATSARGNPSGAQVLDSLKPTKLVSVSPDPRDVTKLLDVTVRAVVAAGGRLLGSNVRGIFEPGRTATSGRSDQSIAAAVPETAGGRPNSAPLPSLMRQLPGFFHTDWTRAEALRSQFDRRAASDNYQSLQSSRFEVHNRSLAELTGGLTRATGTPLATSAIGMTQPVIGAGAQLEGVGARHPEVVHPVGAVDAAVAAAAATLRRYAAASKPARAPASLSELFGAATGIETRGQGPPSIPTSLIHSTSLAALGAGIGSFAEFGGGTLTSAVIGAGAQLALRALSNGRPFLSTDGIGGVQMGDPMIPPRPNTHAAASDPMPVYVVNGRDLADGTSAHQAHQLARPPTGPTAPDVRMSLPTPGMVLPAMIGP